MLQVGEFKLAHKRENIQAAVVVRSTAIYDLIERYLSDEHEIWQYYLLSHPITAIYSPTKFAILVVAFYHHQGQPTSVQHVVKYHLTTTKEHKAVKTFFDMFGMADLLSSKYMTEYECGVLTISSENYQFSPHAVELPHFLICNHPTIPFSNNIVRNFHTWLENVKVDECEDYYIVKARWIKRGIIFPNHASVGYYVVRFMYEIEKFMPSDNVLYVVPKVRTIDVIYDTCEWHV